MTVDFRKRLFAGILGNRLELVPRGNSCFTWHSALSPTARPTARESDPTVKESAESPNEGLMQEGGGIEPHRAVTRLTAYKAVSTPNGLRLPKKAGRCHARLLSYLRFVFGVRGEKQNAFSP